MENLWLKSPVCFSSHYTRHSILFGVSDVKPFTFGWICFNSFTKCFLNKSRSGDHVEEEELVCSFKDLISLHRFSLKPLLSAVKVPGFVSFSLLMSHNFHMIMSAGFRARPIKIIISEFIRGMWNDSMQMEIRSDVSCEVCVISASLQRHWGF